MVLSTLRFIVPILSLTTALQAATPGPDISNLNNCINEVRQANVSPPVVPTFDPYKKNYAKLLSDLNAVTPTLPYVYQEAAAKPLVQYLTNLGEKLFLRLFNQNPQDQLSQTLQQIIPDAVLSILFHDTAHIQSVNAFQEISSDLYASFISEEQRVSKETGKPINAPTYGVIPPLVKFGNADAGPYTWPCDATTQLLGMRCAVVSLPPAQLKGGLLAWASLGHETGGHDVLHADAGLLAELAKKVHDAVLSSSKSEALASYWATCIDETASDVCGYLHMGPAAGISLIGYFRALGNGKLRTIGSRTDPHPIDLLRGYLAAAVAKRLNFKAAKVWSEALTKETARDNNTLYMIDRNMLVPFPVSLDVAIASTDVVAEVITRAKLSTLQGHSLQEIQDWTDNDQEILKSLVQALNSNGQIPANLRGPGFYAAHVVSASTLAGLKLNANIAGILTEMRTFLEIMHNDNPLWSKTPTVQALHLLESAGVPRSINSLLPHSTYHKLPDFESPEDDSTSSDEEESAA